jgi:ribosomal protein S14
MKSLQQKDLLSRKFFVKVENLKKIINFLRLNLSNIKQEKKIKFYLFFFNLVNKKFSKVKIKSRCVLTNRGRGVYSKYSLSRIQLRSYLQIGIIPGHKKAVW